MGRRFRLFVNRAAGSVADGGEQLAAIEAAFAAADATVTVSEVAPDDLAAGMIEAWATGVDAVIVAGGDGTINAAAAVAVQHRIVLGVLPMGTFNHFAKDLGVPEDLQAAAAYLANAPVTEVDVGEVNGTVFVNNASIGVYPAMVIDRERIRRQRGWGKVRAAPVAIAHTLRRLPVQQFQLALEGAPAVSVATPFLFIGNGLFDDHGGRLGTRTALDDHRLGVYVIAVTGRWRLVTNAVRARIGGLGAAPQTERLAATELTISAASATVTIAVDGEPLTLPTPLHVRTLPAALRVLAT